MAKYERDIELEEIMRKVINREERFSHLRDEQLCTIVCQWCDTGKRNRGREIYADTMLMHDKVKRLAGFEFVITFYKTACKRLDDEHMERLMFHELCHIGFDDHRYYIVPHDIEDFWECVNRWGKDWIRS